MVEKEKVLNKNKSTEISEIFSSLQGEGPYLGVPQIFVRFGRCNMHCGYCDELEKMKAGAFEILSFEETLSAIQSLESEKGPHHSVSLTGGEPLVYAPFLKHLLPELKRRGFKTYLETNGTLPAALESVIDDCDIIAMDLKPSSSTGDRNFWEAHEAFLKMALKKEVFVKVVVTPETKRQEIEAGAELVARLNPKIPFIFQPLSDPLGINPRALELIEKDFFAVARNLLDDLRVIPQMHKIWGVR